MTDYLASRLRRIGAAYDALPGTSLDATIPYQLFNGEIELQLLTIPMRIVYTDTDPYVDANDMVTRVAIDRMLRVYTGGNPHPLLTTMENAHFRAVHDYYGHIVPGNSFDVDGEFHAWQCHYHMFRTSGGRATVTTETLGQLAWRVYGPNEHMPYADRPYAEQKVGLLDPALYLDLVEYTSD